MGQLRLICVSQHAMDGLGVKTAILLHSQDATKNADSEVSVDPVFFLTHISKCCSHEVRLSSPLAP